MQETWLDRLLQRFRLLRLRKQAAYLIFYPDGGMQGHLPNVEDEEFIPQGSPVFWASTCMLMTSESMHDLVETLWDRAMKENLE